MDMYTSLILLFLHVFCADAILGPGGEATKPPKHRETLQWPSNHLNYVAARPQVFNQEKPRENYRDIVLVHNVQSSRPESSELCPDKATGQFTYLPDCRKFINCWKGRGFIQACAPGTLFNPASLECDFPAKVKCLPYDEEGKSEALKQESTELEATENFEATDYVGKGMIDVRLGSESADIPSSASSTTFTSTKSRNLPGSELENSHSLFVPTSQQTSKHLPASSIYPNYNFQENPHSFQPTPTAFNQKLPSGRSFIPSQGKEELSNLGGYPSSPSPWLQPPPVSSIPSQHQGRFPPRRPLTFYPENVHNVPPGAHSHVPRYPLSPGHGQNPWAHQPGHQNFPPNHSNFPKPYSPYFGQPKENPVNYNQHASQSPVTFPGNHYPHSPVHPSQFPGNFPQTHHNRPQHPDTLSQHSDNQHYIRNPTEMSGQSSGTSNYPTNTHNSTENVYGLAPPTEHKADCSMPGGSGVAPHPTDCRKYLNCWKGVGVAQFCSPGTLFNPVLLQCDHPHKVDCRKSASSQDPKTSQWKPMVNDSFWTAESHSVEHRVSSVSIVTEPSIGGTRHLTPEPSKSYYPTVLTTKKPVHTPTRPLHTPTSTSKKPISVPTEPARRHTSRAASTTNQPIYVPPNSPQIDNSSVSQTTKKPTNIMSITTPKVSHSKSSSQPHLTTPIPKVSYSPSLMTNGQVLRLRGGQGSFDGYVEIQGPSPGWGLVCDETNKWEIEEASVVCKQLGYVRGAELSWQGRPVRPTDDTIHVSVSEVQCSGNEKNFLSCRMTQGAGRCLIPRDAVGVRCFRNFVSVCQEGEINHGGKCYSVIVPKEDTALEAFSHGEALADCQKRKGKLLDITSQEESDFISELLLQSYPHINSIITSGVGVKVMGHPLWIWESSGDTFKFQKWWPGWTGNETAPTAKSAGERMQCVVAKRVFPCQAPYLPDIVGVANLCEANYFYWATEDCSVTHDHPYICERPHDDVGCVTNAGQDYMGTANISSTGSSCLSWDSPLTPSALKYRMPYKERQRTMVGHNHCRNVEGGETHPWCYVGPDAQFQYCDIPPCQSSVLEDEMPKKNEHVTPSSLPKCGLEEFECTPGECILSSLLCNTISDCSNGKDEENCADMPIVSLKLGSGLNPEDIKEGDDVYFECNTQSNPEVYKLAWFHKGLEIHHNVTAGVIISDQSLVLQSVTRHMAGDYTCFATNTLGKGKSNSFELKVMSVEVDTNSPIACQSHESQCSPGSCIPTVWWCDGVEDCPNGNDEKHCPGVQKTVRGGLRCGPKEFQCQPGECILLTWVCDGAKDCSNGRDEKECSGLLGQFSKHLNQRLIKHEKQKWLESDASMCAEHCLNAKGFTCRSFSHLAKDRICILSDSNVGLSGDLNHTVGWQYYERMSTTLHCDNMLLCDNGKCVNKSMICDGKNNCGDRTDEKNCTREYLDYEIRLAGGNSSNEGRIEVKVFGEWGAICDDLFGLRDAEVVCRELNFTMGAAEVVGQSMFGGTSPKFLVDDLQCRGNETSIRECDFDGWGVHDCGPEEAVGVVCRVPGVDCKVNYWRCDKSSECIPIAFLCDNVPDCEDGSDESDEHCKAPIKMRLVGGPSNMSGRVEVQYNGVWGTICDDDFTDTAAQVICGMMGFGGPAVAKKDAAFGPGEGQIWLDQLHCTGKESHIEDCLHSHWGENNCAHEEDASVVCSSGNVATSRNDRNKPRVVETVATSGDITANQILPAYCGLKMGEFLEMANRSEFRVLGGNEVAQGSFPWQASLRVRTTGKSVHWCGAAVISPLHILTAGHCLQDYTKGAYLVRAGDHDTEVYEGTEQELSIEEIYMHEGFNRGPRLNNDIALVKLKSGGFRLNPAVQPICLPPSNIRYHSGLNCSISGWGTIKAGGTGYARKLQAAWISVIPDNICKADYVYGSKAITEGMTCAGDLEGRSDSCQGDSGGPLICLNNGRFTLYGITSWGHGCGRANKPGVYSNIGHFRSWIDEKLKMSMTGK